MSTENSLPALVAAVLPPEAKRDKPTLKELRKRIRAKDAIIQALEYVVDHDATYADAADKFGVSYQSLSRLRPMPAVQEYLDARCEVRLLSLRSKAVAKVSALMDGRSEYVQLEAARTVLSETKKTEHGVAGNVHIEIVL